MGKSGKIIIFIVVAFVLIVMATIMKEVGAGAVVSIAVIAIVILYQAMFNKSKDKTEQSPKNDIKLKK